MKKVIITLLVGLVCIFTAACSTTVDVTYPHIHEYDGVFEMTETDHRRQCVECNQVNEGSKGAHIWDEQHKCIICRYPGKHTWDNAHKCIVCEYQGTHTWEDTHKCTVCGYQGTHTYGEWVKDEDADTHTKTCVCGNSVTENCAGGTATTQQKAKCDDCGGFYGALVVAHDYENGSWITTATEHKKQCATCTEIDSSTQGAHVWDNTHKCTVCNYQGQHALSATWVENGVDGTHEFTCACGTVSVACDCPTWDGSVGTLPAMANNEMVINTAEELAALAQSVNQANTYSGKTIKLNADIHLGNQPWTPIGTSTTHFYGNFDGQGHTVYGLNVSLTGENADAGLFGWICGSTIQNLTIDGANVSTEERGGILVGYAVPSGGTTIYNCHVNNAVLTGGRVGGIIGFYTSGGENTISSCSVKNTKITGAKTHGEIVGYHYNNVIGTNVQTENVELLGTPRDSVVVLPESQTA